MIIFLHGPDTFRSRRKLKEVKEKFIKEIDKSALNIEVLNGEKLEPHDFENAIFTPPFLAKKRLVIIEDLISKNKGQKLQKEILEILDKGKLEDTVVVFWEGGAGSQKKSKSKLSSQRSKLLFARLAKEKFAQEFKLLGENEVYHWTEAEIKARQGKIKPDALKLLTDLVGSNLWQMSSEIDKLLAFVKGQEITLEEINSLVKTKLDEDVFKLTDALGQKNKAAALKLISDQLQSGTAPTELLAKITWQFRNLLVVKGFTEANGSGYDPSSLSYQLGLHPFVVKKTMAQVRDHSFTELKKNYQALLKIDRQLKTSQLDPEVLFDLLVAKN